MKITVRAFWDDEAKVWVAVADGELGLITEAASVEALQKKLPMLAEDLLEGDYSGEFEIRLVTESVRAGTAA